MSLINTQLTTPTLVTAGGSIPIGNVIHKCGSGLNAGGNAIRANSSGYLRITANVTVEPTAIGDITLVANENGSQIASATGNVATASDPINLTIVALIYNRCGCNIDAISFSLSASGTVTEMDVIVEGV